MHTCIYYTMHVSMNPHVLYEYSICTVYIHVPVLYNFTSASLAFTFMEEIVTIYPPLLLLCVFVCMIETSCELGPSRFSVASTHSQLVGKI